MGVAVCADRYGAELSGSKGLTSADAVERELPLSMESFGSCWLMLVALEEAALARQTFSPLLDGSGVVRRVAPDLIDERRASIRSWSRESTASGVGRIHCCRPSDGDERPGEGGLAPTDASTACLTVRESDESACLPDSTRGSRLALEARLIHRVMLKRPSLGD